MQPNENKANSDTHVKHSTLNLATSHEFSRVQTDKIIILIIILIITVNVICYN